MHLRNIYAKLNVNSGTAAVAKALGEKLVDRSAPPPAL
jgi:DNA-binding CsgD family transcriptional regulator